MTDLLGIQRLNEAGRAWLEEFLQLALREALSRYHNYVGPEHLQAAAERRSSAP